MTEPRLAERRWLWHGILAALVGVIALCGNFQFPFLRPRELHLLEPKVGVMWLLKGIHVLESPDSPNPLTYI